jgi:hypothetical protein
MNAFFPHMPNQRVGYYGHIPVTFQLMPRGCLLTNLQPGRCKLDIPVDPLFAMPMLQGSLATQVFAHRLEFQQRRRCFEETRVH